MESFEKIARRLNGGYKPQIISHNEMPMYQKYIKYKNKYLKLKKLHNNIH